MVGESELCHRDPCHSDHMTTDTPTTVSEIAEGVHRISTYLADGPPGGITFNQFVVLGDETLLFHTGTRRLFPSVHDAAATVVDPASVRWISSGHASRPDEYGALNEWESVAPSAVSAHGRAGCFLCLSDMSTRPPRPLADGEVIDIGGHLLRWIDTPHVPGPWEAGVVFDETTKTLFCGDLFSRTGPAAATTSDGIADAAIAHDQLMHGHAYTPHTGPTLRRLAGLHPERLALMHGPTYVGDGGGQLSVLAHYFDGQVTAP
jgi:flavorubredoxin